MEKRLTRRSMLGAALAASAGMAASSTISRAQTSKKPPDFTFKFSHIEPVESATGKTADFFAEKVFERTNGRIKIDIFPAGQLSGGGDVRVELERVQLGIIDFTPNAGTMWLSEFDPKFNIVQLPFLFKDDKTYLGYIKNQPTAQDMLKSVERNGFKALTFWPRPYRLLSNSRRTVRTPADMRGLKVRLPAVEIMTDAFAAFGAAPVAMSFAELYTALQSGTVDGQDNAIEVIWSSRFYEVQKFVTRLDYARDALMPSMNKRKFDALPADMQQILVQAAIDAAEFRLNFDRTNADRFQKQLQEKGVEVTVLSDAEKAAFKAAAEPVWAKWSQRLGKPFFDQVVREVG